MKNLFATLLFILFSVPVSEGFAQTRSSELNELPESVLNTEFQMLGARTLKLSEYLGKPLVINVFATWCEPCRFGSPDLARLYKEFKDRGLVVIELSAEDPKTSKETVREWAWTFRLPYPVGWATPEFLTLTQARSYLPHTLIIAPDGRIVRRFIGYDPTMTPGQMREAVEEALK